jgi:hypothetical protein
MRHPFKIFSVSIARCWEASKSNVVFGPIAAAQLSAAHQSFGVDRSPRMPDALCLLEDEILQV